MRPIKDSSNVFSFYLISDHRTTTSPFSQKNTIPNKVQVLITVCKNSSTFFKGNFLNFFLKLVSHPFQTNFKRFIFLFIENVKIIIKTLNTLINRK